MVLPAILLYLALATWRLRFPGLHYDEMFYVNGALGDIDGNFIFAKLGNLPVFLLPYIGALKAWIFFPIFKIFGVSVWSMRLPNILISAFGLCLYKKLAQALGGKQAAWMALFLLAVNASFVYATKMDFGPVVLEFVLQIAAVLAFWTGGALSLSIFLLLGIFNKMNFLGWIFGFGLSACVLYPEKRRVLAVPLALCLIYTVAWFILRGNEIGGEMADNPSLRLETLRVHALELIEGSSLYYPFLSRRSGIPIFPALWVLSALASVFWLWRKKMASREILFLVMMLLFATAASLSSVRARSYWHFFYILPWFYLLTTLLLTRIGRMGISVWVICFLFVLSGHRHFFKKQSEAPQDVLLMSEAIYPLIEICKTESAGCVAGEWGMYSQLQAMIQEPKRIRQYPRTAGLEVGPLYVVYGVDLNLSSAPVFKAWGAFGKRTFFHEAEQAGYDLELAHTVKDRDVPVFELYRLIKPVKQPEPKRGRISD